MSHYSILLQPPLTADLSFTLQTLAMNLTGLKTIQLRLILIEATPPTDRLQERSSQ